MASTYILKLVSDGVTIQLSAMGESAEEAISYIKSKLSRLLRNFPVDQIMISWTTPFISDQPPNATHLPSDNGTYTIVNPMTVTIPASFTSVGSQYDWTTYLLSEGLGSNNANFNPQSIAVDLQTQK